MAKRLLLLIAIAVLLLTAFLGGYTLNKKTASPPPEAAPATVPAAAGKERKILYWHDPMVPQQHFDKPGKSPFMDMQMVPVYADATGDDGGITISPRVIQNLGVRTARVETGVFAKEVRTVGTVKSDEHRIEVVQSRAAGWVERLEVKAVNDPVRRGQVLAEVYAPDLLAAQEEYVLALKNHDDALIRAARARLSFLGLAEVQIAALEKIGKPARRIAFYAPIDGVVAELGVRQGMAVSPGMMMFNLVDLSVVWVNAEIIENQAGWVNQGDGAEVRISAYPGKVFKGKVDYLYPGLNAETRTIKARIVLKNPEGLLKPDMFVDVALFGKAGGNALLVPSEALIHTGRRTVVIVAEGEGMFRPVEVVAGGEAGGKTEILKGLQPGQTVVASGQFLIDSEASLRTALERFEPEGSRK